MDDEIVASNLSGVLLYSMTENVAESGLLVLNVSSITVHDSGIGMQIYLLILNNRFKFFKECKPITNKLL